MKSKIFNILYINNYKFILLNKIFIFNSLIKYNLIY